MESASTGNFSDTGYNLLGFMNTGVQSLDLEDVPGVGPLSLRSIGPICTALRSLNLRSQVCLPDMFCSGVLLRVLACLVIFAEE